MISPAKSLHSRSLARMSFVLVAVALAACAEKGVPQKDYNELLGRVEELKSQVDRQKSAAEQCAKQLAAAGSATGDNAVVLRVEGDTVSVVGRPSKPTGGGDVKDEVAIKVGGAFEGQIRGSKAGIQLCYVNALKKNESLQTTEVTLQIGVVANPTGKLTSPSFSPQISPDFTACMHRIAASWKVPTYTGGSFPIVYPVTLKPTE